MFLFVSLFVSLTLVSTFVARRYDDIYLIITRPIKYLLRKNCLLTNR